MAASESTTARALSLVAVPWNAFVGAFVYYTVLTIVAISGAEPPVTVMAIAYALPLAAYAAILVLRAGRTLSAIRIDLFHTPHAVIR